MTLLAELTNADKSHPAFACNPQNVTNAKNGYQGSGFLVLPSVRRKRVEQMKPILCMVFDLMVLSPI